MATDTIARALAIAALAVSALTLIWLVIDAYFIDAARLRVRVVADLVHDESGGNEEHFLTAVIYNRGKRGVEIQAVWFSAQRRPMWWARLPLVGRISRWELDRKAIVELTEAFVEGSREARYPVWLDVGRAVRAARSRADIVQLVERTHADRFHLRVQTTIGLQTYRVRRLPTEFYGAEPSQAWPIEFA